MVDVRLNRKMVLEAQIRVADGAGGYLETWNEQGAHYVELRARSGGETSGEEASLSRTRFRIILRAAPFGAPSRPEPGQRFRDGVRIFHITSVAEYDRQGRFLSCMADEELVT